MTLIIIVAVMLALFGLAFATKRRFGVLGLSLAAGIVLAQSASGYSADFLESQQLPVAPLTYETTAVILLTLLPSLLLMVSGPAYTSKKAAALGAAGYALLGVMLIMGPLTTVLPASDAAVKPVFDVLARWQDYIVITAILAALLDTVMVHGMKIGTPKASKH